MDKRASLVAVVALAGGCLWPAAARAEVSVETDPFGNYLRTVVYANTSGRTLRVWGVQRSRPLAFPLNRQGDFLRDGWPTIAENPAAGGWPWVFWSRSNGSDYDLVYSRWLGAGWSEIAWVEAGPSAGDDLDPSADFDDEGQAVLAWWRNESGTGRIYLSRFQSAGWTAPLLLSDPAVDSRYPTVTALPDGAVRVDFHTPDGTVSVVVSFRKPLSINDDLAPVGATPSAGKGNNSTGSGK
jgi:hypothetical protein